MSELPEHYQRTKQQYPQLVSAYEALAEAAKEAGPLDSKTAALVKVALCITADLEGGSHSAVRKALSTGCTPEEIRHVALLGITTLGFPAMMRAGSWIEDVLSEHD